MIYLPAFRSFLMMINIIKNWTVAISFIEMLISDRVSFEEDAHGFSRIYTLFSFK